MTRDELIESHLHVTRILAAQAYRRIRGRIELCDLEAMGNVALIEAAERYDPARGVKFKSYASRRIVGAMQDGIRKNMHVERNAHIEIRDRWYPIHWPVEFALNVPDPAPGAEEKACGTISRSLLDCLNVRERIVIDATIAGKLDSDTAARLGTCYSRIAQLRNSAVERMRAAAA